jgi:parvulin-like peptidyl-prolyl isomerase
MAKKAKQTAIVTKKQIALGKRERQRQRWAIIGLVAVTIMVAGVLGVGAYQELIAKPAEPIAIVNGEPIRTDTYQKRVRYRRWELDQTIAQIRAQLSQIDPNSSGNEFLISYFQQALSQVSSRRAQLGSTAVDELIQEALIRQKAAAEQITVSEEEVTREIERRIALSGGLMTSFDATATVAAGPQATATALGWTPTPIPTPTPTLTATLTITETEPLSPTATPEPTPTPHIITEQESRDAYAQYLQRLAQGPGLSEAEYREMIKADLLYDEVQKFFVAHAPTTAEQVHASHILLNKEEDARKALARVEGGEDFAQVAKEVSEDEKTRENGGDLGWFPRDTIRVPPSVADAAFSVQPGHVVTDVVQSYQGFHVVKTLERQPDRPLSEDDLPLYQRKAFTDWLQEQMGSQAVVRLWTPDKVPPDTVGGQEATQ